MDLFKKNQPKLLKVEVSEKNVRLRVVLVVLLLAAGLSLLAYWFYSLITKEPGWYTVELTEGPVELNDEFIFNYRLEGDKRSAADEYKDRITLECTWQPRSLWSCSIAFSAVGSVAALIDRAINTSSV